MYLLQSLARSASDRDPCLFIMLRLHFRSNEQCDVSVCGVCVSVCHSQSGVCVCANFICKYAVIDITNTKRFRKYFRRRRRRATFSRDAGSDVDGDADV